MATEETGKDQWRLGESGEAGDAGDCKMRQGMAGPGEADGMG